MRSSRNTIALSLLSLALCASVHAQQVTVEARNGELSVNGRVIDSIPPSLDIGDSSFRVRLFDGFPVILDFNGTIYRVTDDAIEEADDGSEADFVMRNSGKSLTVKASSSGLDGTIFLVEDRLLDGLNAMSRGFKVDAGNEEDWVSWSPHAHWTDAIESAQQALMAFPDPHTMLSINGYLESTLLSDSDLFGRLKDELRMEQQTTGLAMQIMSMDEGNARDRKIEELETLLDDVFELKQDNRRLEIKRLESELEDTKLRLMEKEEAKDRLIDARLKQLLGNRR